MRNLSNPITTLKRYYAIIPAASYGASKPKLSLAFPRPRYWSRHFDLYPIGGSWPIILYPGGASGNWTHVHRDLFYSIYKFSHFKEWRSILTSVSTLPLRS